MARGLPSPLPYRAGGHLALVVVYTPRGAYCEPKPGRWRLDPADRERAASFASRNVWPPMGHDEMYDFLFPRGVA